MNELNRAPILGVSGGKLHIVWCPDDYVTLSTDAFKKLIGLVNDEVDDTCTCGRPRADCPSGHWAGIYRVDTYVYYIQEYASDWFHDRLDLGIFASAEDAMNATPNKDKLPRTNYRIIEKRVVNV